LREVIDGLAYFDSGAAPKKDTYSPNKDPLACQCPTYRMDVVARIT
jgi:hypothetical protein